MVAESQDYSFDGNLIYMNPGYVNEGILKAFISTKGIVYYHGYFCNQIYIKLIQDILKKEIVFPQLVDSSSLQYESMIKNTESVALHIRRGDFVACGRAVSPEKYAMALVQMDEKYGDTATYFVFSDDLAWCSGHEDEIGISGVAGEVIYVQANYGNGNNYIDMQLMSLCKHMIISNSSFGLWAYYLNETKDLDVIYVNKL